MVRALLVKHYQIKLLKYVWYILLCKIFLGRLTTSLRCFVGTHK